MVAWAFSNPKPGFHPCQTPLRHILQMHCANFSRRLTASDLKCDSKWSLQRNDIGTASGLSQLFSSIVTNSHLLKIFNDLKSARSSRNKQKQMTGTLMLKRTGFTGFWEGHQRSPAHRWETSSQEGIPATDFTEHDIIYAPKISRKLVLVKAKPSTHANHQRREHFSIMHGPTILDSGI